MKRLLDLILLAILLVMVPPARAERYALLMGLDEYAAPIPKLEGPHNDVLALRDVLTSKWGFSRDNVQVLLGADATHLGILNATTSLIAKSNSGDFVFIFFAGHGTSAEDRGLLVPLPHTTGALIPIDFAMRDPAGMQESLIIGRRDLRPLLETLDKGGRQVFVAIDACYSGNTVRGRQVEAAGRPALPVREVNIPGRSGQPTSSASQSEPYPYQHVVYFSAAADNEAASEIPKEFLKFYPTLDGKPHGAFTDALLRALSGDLGSSFHGSSYYQVHAAIRAFMGKQGYPQTPQLLPLPSSSSDWNAKLPIFGSVVSGEKIASPAIAAERQQLRIAVQSDVPREVREKILAKSTVLGVTQGADLTLIAKGHRLTLLSSGGDVIASADDSKPQLILQAVDQQRWLQRFINTAASHPSGLALEFDDEQLGATRVAGDRLGFRLVAEQPAYLAVLTIDAEGTARLLYPAFADEMVLSPAHEVLRLSGIDVVGPFGVDSIVAFALPERPDWLTPYIGKDVTMNSGDWPKLASDFQRHSGTAPTAFTQAITAP